MPLRFIVRNDTLIPATPYAPICISHYWYKRQLSLVYVSVLTGTMARHTFATMMLTLGMALYTTSKLLGHADVKKTQVYAKIINQKKDDAVNLVK